MHWSAFRSPLTESISLGTDRWKPGTMQPMHLVTDPSSASAALLLLPGAHPLHHHQQQAQHLQQQQQQQQHFGQSQPFHPVLLTPPQSSAPSMPTQNTNGAQRQYSERERQIKRRTKTGSAMQAKANSGCMTCRKRRIKVGPVEKVTDDSATKGILFVSIVRNPDGTVKDTHMAAVENALNRRRHLLSTMPRNTPRHRHSRSLALRFLLSIVVFR